VVPIGRSARGRYLVHKTAKRVLINNFKERLFGALQLQRTTLNHIRTKCFEWIQAGSPRGWPLRLYVAWCTPLTWYGLCCVVAAVVRSLGPELARRM
jgi:hypothetical protein